MPNLSLFVHPSIHNAYSVPSCNNFYLLICKSISPPANQPALHLTLSILSSGRYQDAKGQTQCKPCKKGHFSTGKATTCEACPAGKHQSRRGQTSCKICPKKTFSKKGQATCTKCKAGTFSNETGLSKCHHCPAGHYQPREGQTSCLKCQAGYHSDTKADRCKPCSIGYNQSAEAQAHCLPCPKGTYADVTGSLKCKSCGKNEYQNEEGQASCNKCGDHNRSKPGSNHCFSCDAGYEIGRINFDNAGQAGASSVKREKREVHDGCVFGFNCDDAKNKVRHQRKSIITIHFLCFF